MLFRQYDNHQVDHRLLDRWRGLFVALFAVVAVTLVVHVVARVIQ